MSASGSFFVDTNVLLYRFDAVDPEKRLRAITWFSTLWEGRAGHISWQVVLEFYANAARKTGVSQSIARDAVKHLMLWKPEPTVHATIQRAWHWCDSAQINFWDALIVAAAEQCGCRWLLSEDFQAGRKFGSLMVVNPFERGPDEFGMA